jgi:hypothetical protein
VTTGRRAQIAGQTLAAGLFWVVGRALAHEPRWAPTPLSVATPALFLVAEPSTRGDDGDEATRLDAPGPPRGMRADAARAARRRTGRDVRRVRRQSR